MPVVIEPRTERRSYKPSALLLAGPVASTRRVISFVRDWDPNKHPRGYKGLFTDTPDRHAAGNAAAGDVIATKSGKVFHVEGHGPKGIKVSSIDPDSGEVLTKGTIVANNIEVAKLVGSKGPGSKHEIGQLDPGTFITHPRSGKRFVIHKHGNWTTVYPVDANGEIAGKHTVLPPKSEVMVTGKIQGQQVTQQHVAQIAVAQKAAQVGPEPQNKLGVRKGDFIKGKNTGTVYEVHGVSNARGEADPVNGQFIEVLDHDTGKLTIIDPDVYEKTGRPEEMPQNLPRPPRPYAEGVGQNTAVVIEEKPQLRGYRIDPQNKSTYVLKRVPDPNNPHDAGEVLGSYSGVGVARKAARSIGESHEAIIETRTSLRDEYVPPKGSWVIANGILYEVDEARSVSSYYGPKLTMTTTAGFSGEATFDASAVIPVHDIKALDQFSIANFNFPLASGQRIYESFGGNPYRQQTLLQAAMDQNRDKASTVRQARPNLYLDALRHDFDPSTLIGKSKGETLRTLRLLGFGEVTPREPNMTKYVNARGRRLHIHNKGGVVTAIDEIKVQAALSGDGAAAYHSQLKAVLDNGGDVEPLEPGKGGDPEKATAHTRRLLYDMALGKQNGVERLFDTGSSTVKVKSDTKYRDEITADASFPKKASYIGDVEDPGLNVPLRSEVMDKHFPGWRSGMPNVTFTGNNLHLHGSVVDDGGTSVTAVAIAMAERNGFADWAAKEYGATDFAETAKQVAMDYDTYSSDPGDPDTAFAKMTQGQRDYVMTTLLDIDPRAQRQWDLRESEMTRRLDAIYESKLTDEIAKRRKIEGTVASVPGKGNTFELPLWDDIEMEEQDLGEVESMIQNAPSIHQQVPVFYSGGVLQDGYMYHFKTPSGESRMEGRVPAEFERTVVQRMAGARATQNSQTPDPYGNSRNVIRKGTMYELRDGKKRIEFVPHTMDRQQANASQRGRLTFIGYTPEEASAKAKDLGLVHDVEEHVPFRSIMRGRRRFGQVAPLHSDYVSGQAPLPTIPSAIVHGMDSGALKTVFESGGLMPIAERYKLGISLAGSTIARNDIAAGVDFYVFAAMGTTASAYGDANVVYKDSAFLRRDVLITDRVFSASGGGDGRYPSYRNYHNRHRKAVGIKDANQSAYAIMEPEARQSHINERYSVARSASNLSASNNEWDLRGMPIEDMATVYVPNSTKERELNQILDHMVAQGRISERPDVQVGGGRYSGSPLSAAERPAFKAPAIGARGR